MTVTKLNNRLVTPELREALSDYPLYSQDAKGKDAALHRSVSPWQYPLVYYGRTARRR